MKKRSFKITLLHETSLQPASPVKMTQWIEAMLKTLGLREGELTVCLTSDKSISRLNRKYLGHRGPTDVMAFPACDQRPFKTAPNGRPHLGDIAVSLETTARQARDYGNSFEYELAFCLCHGILHLLGWEDKTQKQRTAMWKKQAAILHEIFR